ncbi:hypothetical protein CA267_007930 [Alteromonas pelagimontana]|uniref:Uncharacterized protein n=1 Tax=Alteromonas pelagimontana TaxID=1858656 RepID=A0A6M4MC05_9ALTE|nr:hypothetical protein [Alteromonas pelagimontana]QJR80712.1 hypothetical protein CA267_007930 [Alteromonas pelagimontana]
MRNTAFSVVEFLLLTASLPAFSHAGHDHAHWAASLLHFLFYGSLIAAVAACTFAAWKQLHRHREQKSAEQNV